MCSIASCLTALVRSGHYLHRSIRPCKSSDIWDTLFLTPLRSARSSLILVYLTVSDKNHRWHSITSRHTSLFSSLLSLFHLIERKNSQLEQSSTSHMLGTFLWLLLRLALLSRFRCSRVFNILVIVIIEDGILTHYLTKRISFRNLLPFFWYVLFSVLVNGWNPLNAKKRSILYAPIHQWL